MPIAREALGAAVELRVVEGVSCAPVEGVEMGAVQAEVSSINSLFSPNELISFGSQNTLDSIIPRLPSQENALILIIQPLLLPLPHRNTTNPHTSYFLLLHRPASQGAAEVHAVSVTQSIPLIEAKGRMSGWLEEQKMRGLESGVYSLFESLGAGEREEGEPLDAFA